MISIAHLKRGFALVLVSLGFAGSPNPASAQSYDPDPFGWGARTMEQQRDAGLQEACRSYANEYNTIVEFYNQARDQRTRAEWRERLDSIRREAASQGCRL